MNKVSVLTEWQSPQVIDWQQQPAPPALRQQLDDVIDDAVTSWAGGQDGGLVSDAEAESNYDEIARKSQALVESCRTTSSRPTAHASSRTKAKRAEQ